ncbi:MAG: bifunctional dTDP-4-dehydrorhamnose 3,5-epimerase family protein/NAD(P)-dependent oxidoreductase [Nocardioidaceae bacterium]|nr:bifunctional dTDP-4-dehydrorhamnose 3,5-epimerase family protein/NAD(P)-dependent oxidoreductase [Nocardioidaceae bacterium]
MATTSTRGTIESTPVPGLLVVRLDVHEDARGWFKEGWQRQRMTGLGLPDFGPVQHNVSFNTRRGVTRGIHAEPWDKLVSVAAGRVFAAWVDLRDGASFGATHWLELGPETAVFVPRGVGNAYQALEDGTAYSYLVNEHYVPGRSYPAVDLGDATAAIPWPVPLAEADLSEKDRTNPALAGVLPVPPPRTLVLGGDGQLGRALARSFPDADVAGRDRLDISSAPAVAAWPWQDYDIVLNAAAYTQVDQAETRAGLAEAWATNAAGVAALARAAREHRLTFVHYSTDYVFDGRAAAHAEDEPVVPLNVYGQSKAAGELAATSVPHHYLLRTSWCVGAGDNFVRTMAALAARGARPAVVTDQVGRLTFSSTLADATRHLLTAAAPWGTYHVSNAGTPMSWFDLAREVFALCGRSPEDVRPTTTAAYAAGRLGARQPFAVRPASSVLALDKLVRTGFQPVDQLHELKTYLGEDPHPWS